MQAYHVTDGRAVFASGNPFDDVLMKGNRFIPGQCNNVYIFPGVGLGIVASRSRLVPNEMRHSWSRRGRSQTKFSGGDRAEGRIYPGLSRIREVSLAIAIAVAERVFAQGLASAQTKRLALLS